MPPALAGDNSDVTFDGDGLSNIAMVAGGLTIFGIVMAVASRASSQILEATTGSGDRGFVMEVQ